MIPLDREGGGYIPSLAGNPKMELVQLLLFRLSANFFSLGNAQLTFDAPA